MEDICTRKIVKRHVEGMQKNRLLKLVLYYKPIGKRKKEKVERSVFG
jgi:hypothetical protein